MKERATRGSNRSAAAMPSSACASRRLAAETVRASGAISWTAADGSTTVPAACYRAPGTGKPRRSPIDQMQFIVDNNVGRLAVWLRALGYDTVFINPIAD